MRLRIRGAQRVLLPSSVGRGKHFRRGAAGQRGAVTRGLCPSSGKNSCPVVETFCCVFVSISAISALLLSPLFYVLWVYSGLCCVLASYFRFMLQELACLRASAHEEFTCSSRTVLCGRAGGQLSRPATRGLGRLLFYGVSNLGLTLALPVWQIGVWDMRK